MGERINWPWKSLVGNVLVLLLLLVAAGIGAGIPGAFGAPSWVAVQALAMAISKSCSDGKVSRAEVLRNVRKVNMPKSLLGKPVAFLPNGDVKGGINFSIFQIQEDHSYKLVQAG